MTQKPTKINTGRPAVIPSEKLPTYESILDANYKDKQKNHNARKKVTTWFNIMNFRK